MKKLVLVILAVLLSSISYSQSGWYQVTDTNSDVIVSAIQFTSANTGYATTCCGSIGEFLKSTNGGLNWQASQFPGYSVEDLFFLDNNTGFIQSFSYQNFISIIFKTTNGGNNWERQDSLYAIFRIKFYDYNTGFVIAKYSNIRKTTNGGLNWFSQTGVSWSEPSDLCCIDANTWLVISSSNVLNKTTNGGINWILLNITNTGFVGHSLYFINNTTGFCASQNGKMFKTTNTGDNWFQISTIDSFLVTGDMQFVNENTGYLCGFDYYNGGICKTTNGGYNWIKQKPNLNTRFYPLYFLNANTGFVGGYDRILLKTTNGGSVFVSNISSEVPDKFSLSQNYPNPFNPTTKIKFDIPVCHSCESRNPVVLKVYDIQGKEIETLVNEVLQPGTYEATFDGSALNSGVYFYKLISNGFTKTKKILLIK